MTKTTNKQLIKLGVTQEQILNIVFETVKEQYESRNLINSLRFDGDEEYTGIYFQDHKGRQWSVYYMNDENTDTLYADTYKGDCLEEMNQKSFKSIFATVNHIDRLL